MTLRKIRYDRCLPFTKTHSRKHYKNGRNIGKDIVPTEGISLNGTSLYKIVITLIKLLLQKFSFFEHTLYMKLLNYS